MKKRSGGAGVPPEVPVYILLAAVILIAALFYYTGIDPRELSQALPEQVGTLLPGAADTPSPASEPSAPASPASEPSAPSSTPISGRPDGDLTDVLPREGQLSLIAIDVGQGDCLLVVSPDGSTMLIDGGEKEYYPAVSAYLDAAGIRTLTVLVATHPHSDHIGSLRDVLLNYDVKNIYMPAVEHTTKTYLKLLETIKEQGKKIKTAADGASIKLDDAITVDILHPEKGVEYEEMNDYSAVLRICYGDDVALLMGDAEKPSEERLVKEHGDELKAELLKVGHHGSSTSSTNEFLKAVDPKFAIICVGDDNDYDHPNAKVLERLEHRDADIYRTNLYGVVAAYSDGGGFEVVTQR